MAASPNVLFLICHDVGRRYGCYGNPAVHTPRIDGLAEESVLFEQHFCHWPLCGPARANIFSGCRPPTTQRYDNQPFFPNFRARLGADFATLPEHFRRNGYTTAAAGFVFHDVDDPASWSLGHWRPATSEMVKGYGEGTRDGLPAGLRGQWQSPEALALIQKRWQSLQAQGYTEEDLKDEAVARQARGPAVDNAAVPDTAYHGGQVAAHTAELLGQLPRHEPFFVAAGFIDTHLPFWAPRDCWERYERETLPLPGFREAPEGTPEWAMGDSEPAQYYTTHGYTQPWRASDEESRELMHGRCAVLTYFDRLVGQILDALDAAGHGDDTIVVLTSDHGFHDGEHGYWGKHNMWDQSTRVPLMIRLPKACRAAHRVPGLTEHVDLYPTLCALADLPRPGAFLEGASLVPCIENPGKGFKEAVFAHRKPMWHDRIKAYAMADSVRTERYRFTRYNDEAGDTVHTELFDYAEDPEERRNWAGTEAYRDAEADLSKQLEAGWRGVDPEHRTQ